MLDWMNIFFGWTMNVGAASGAVVCIYNIYMYTCIQNTHTIAYTNHSTEWRTKPAMCCLQRLQVLLGGVVRCGEEYIVLLLLLLRFLNFLFMVAAGIFF